MIKKGVRIINDFTIGIILLVFYVFVIPLGKLIFLLNQRFIKRDKKSYWIPAKEGEQVDLTSPY